MITFTEKKILERIGSNSELKLSQIISEYPLVNKSSLLKQLSLHLPRFSEESNQNSQYIMNEAKRLASRLHSVRKPYHSQYLEVTGLKLSLKDLSLNVISEEIARPILERYHYIMSFREDSFHLGLINTNESTWPIALATISPFDLTNMENALPLINGKRASSFVLSRMYIFSGAPPNTASYLLAKLRQWIMQNLKEIDMLITYVNPNVGFIGTSYIADNWISLGEEHETCYYYVNGNYKTDRHIYSIYGHTPEHLIHSTSEVTSSICKLLPLKIFVREIIKLKCRWRFSNLKFNRWSME